MNRARLFFLGGGLLLPLLILLSVTMGSAEIGWVESLSVLFQSPWVEGKGDFSPHSQTIILQLRLPRILLALLCGASLGVAGTVLQGTFQNPMADPYIIGVSSGAALGVSGAILLGATAPPVLQLSAFAGAMVSVALVLFIARLGGGRRQVFVLLLAGMGVSSMNSSLLSLLMYLNRQQVEKILFWAFGSLSTANWPLLLSLAPWQILTIFTLLTQWRGLNLLSQGDESARSLGINPSWVRIGLLVLASLITALSVSATGIIGFVGLMVPHAMRLLTGADHRSLLPLSALYGGIFLLLSDSVGRVLMAPTELPVGIITALLGSPYLLFILVRRGRRGL